MWQRVQDAIRAVPDYFETPTAIEGMLATDIFTLNSALGALIEEQIVGTLNKLRPVWDPQKQYLAYSFVRQSQTFPDVLLRKTTNGLDILMGIELKGWYLFAKERMPNFRFATSALAWNPWDLIVIVPWVLSNVLSGTPLTFRPFIESSRFAAEQRNYYWEHERETTGNRTIALESGIGPYPTKGDKISDKPASDSGGNFGRLARYGIMKAYVDEMLSTPVRGVSVKAWLNFFHSHAETETEEVPPEAS